QANGYRDYSLTAAATLAFIERAKSLGFSLTEIRNHLSMSGASGKACDNARVLLPRLRRKLEEVDAQIAEATAQRTRVVEMIDVLEAREREAIEGATLCGRVTELLHHPDGDRDRRSKFSFGRRGARGARATS